MVTDNSLRKSLMLKVRGQMGSLKKPIIVLV